MSPARTLRASASILAMTDLAAIALAGCAPEPAPTESSSASTSSPASATATQTSTPSASPSPTATLDEAAACLVGNWASEQADLDAYYEQINAAQEGSGASFTPVGRAGLAIREDGTYAWTPAVELTATLSGTEILVTLGGSIDGSYTVTGTTIATKNDSTENLQISATIDGEPTDAGTIGEQIGGAPLTNATFDCTDDTLLLTSSVSGTSVTTTLHR